MRATRLVSLTPSLLSRLKHRLALFAVAVSAFLQKVRAFGSAHVAIMRLGLRLPGQWHQALLISICDFGAVFCEGAVIVAIANASSALETANAKSGSASATGSTAGWIVDGLTAWGMSKTTVVLAISVVVACSLLVGSVLLHYWACVLSRRFARKLHLWWVRGLLNAAGDPRVIASGNLQHDQTELKNAVMQWSIHASKALEVLSRLLQVIVATLSFFFAAFVLNWELMSILVLLALAFAPVAGLVASRIHSTADDFYNSSATQMGTIASRLLVESDRFSIPGLTNKKQVDAFLKSDALKGYFDGFDSVQLASANMALMTGLVRAVIFGVGVTLMAAWVVLYKEPIGRIVAFASILFISLRYLQNCFAYLATLNIYYPQVVRLMSLHDRVSAYYDADSAQLPRSIRAMTAPVPIIFRAKGKSVTLLPGSIVDVVGRFKTTKTDVSRWLPALVKATTPPIAIERLAFSGGRIADLASIDLNELDAMLKAKGSGGLQDFMTRLGFANEWRDYEATVPAPAGESLDGEALAKIPTALGAALIVAELCGSGASELIVDSALLTQLGSRSCELLPSVLGGRRLFATRTPERAPALNSLATLVIAHGALAAILGPDADEKLIADICRDDKDTKAGEVRLDDTLLFDA